MNYKTGHKYRIYPTKKQEQFLAQEFGNGRYIYNNLLGKAKEEKFKYLEFSKLLTQWRSELEWLEAGYRTTQQNSLINLKSAFVRFFKGEAKYPVFKKKGNHNSVRFSDRTNFVGKDYVAVCKELGKIKAKITREVPVQPKEITISRTPDGKYYVSFCVEEEKIPLERKNNSVGIDLGLTDLITLSDGTKIKNPRWMKTKEDRLVRYQRKYSKNKLLPKSNRKNKLRIKIAKLHQLVADARKDFHHKLSRELVEKFQVISVETLNIPKMMKNKIYSRSIHQAGWGQLVSFIKYKASWTGREINEVDQWFASSKICSCCGWKNEELKIEDREWTCKDCGVTHDRDINAATNINRGGLPQINAQGLAWARKEIVKYQRTVNLGEINSVRQEPLWN